MVEVFAAFEISFGMIDWGWSGLLMVFVFGECMLCSSFLWVKLHSGRKT